MRPHLLTISLLAALSVSACDCGGSSTSLGGELTVSTEALAFGEIPIQSTKSLTFTVGNTGSAALAVALSTDSGPFTVTPTDLSIEPAAEAEITVTFAPTALGEAIGTLVVASDGEGTASVELALTGSASPPLVAQARVLPAELDFGDAPRNRPDTSADDQGDPSAPLELSIENPGTAPLQVTEVSFVDDAGGQFRGDLAALVGEIAPGHAEGTTLTFHPTTLGEVTGSLRVRTSAATLPEVIVPLRGRGVAPVLRLCTLVEGDAAETCLLDKPEDYTAGVAYPALNFGAQEELATRGGRVTVRNEGNVPLSLSPLRMAPSSPDLRLWADEARTIPLALGDFAGVLCPAGVTHESCTREGEFSFWVDHWARGTRCCVDARDGVGGDPSCLSIAQDDCRNAQDADEALITVLSSDRLFPFVSLVARGSSLIPVIVVSNFNGALFMDDAFFLRVTNDGDAELRVLSLTLWDPAAPRTCQPDGTGRGTGSAPCSCAGDGTLTCAQFRVDTAPPLVLAPGTSQDVQLTFLDPNPARHEIELHITSTDPVQPLEIATITLDGQGITP